MVFLFHLIVLWLEQIHFGDVENSTCSTGPYSESCISSCAWYRCNSPPKPPSPILKTWIFSLASSLGRYSANKSNPNTLVKIDVVIDNSLTLRITGPKP